MSPDEGAGSGGELKIRGQAEVERRKSKWDDGPSSAGDVSPLQIYFHLCINVTAEQVICFVGDEQNCTS